jgi:hypothetical protein
MEMGPTRYAVRVMKLAGPGVAGLELDPPLYHIDLTPERFAELQTDPVRFSCASSALVPMSSLPTTS